MLFLVEGGGHCHIFPFVNHNPDGPKRSLIKYDAYLKQSSASNKPCFGIKSKSALSELSYFHPIFNSNVDSMHSVFYGVIKNLFVFWFDHPIKSKYSLKNRINAINNRLLQIRPPSFCPSAPRSILDFKIWKANEFMVFIIYYALIVFNQIMDCQYFENLITLVISLQHLFSSEIKLKNIGFVKKLLFLFVSQLPSLYTPQILNSGAHELLHLADFTLDFGPLNFVSCFQFEEINRKILRFIKGNDLVCEEFLKIFSTSQILSSVMSGIEYSHSNDPEYTSFVDFINKYSCVKTSNRKCNKNQLGLRVPKSVIITKDPLISKLIFEYDGSIIDNLSTVNSVFFNEILFNTHHNKTRFDDSCIEVIEENKFGVILNFIVSGDILYIFCQQIILLSNPFWNINITEIKAKMHLCYLSNQKFVVKLTKNLKKCLFYQLDDQISFLSNFQFNHLFC